MTLRDQYPEFEWQPPISQRERDYQESMDCQVRREVERDMMQQDIDELERLEREIGEYSSGD